MLLLVLRQVLVQRKTFNIAPHSVTYDIFLRSWQSAGSNQSLIDMKHFMDICYRLDKKLQSLIAAGFE